MAESHGHKPGHEHSTPAIPPAARLHIWQIQAARDVLFIAAVFGLIYAGYAMRAVTVPLLIALALAYLFEPLIALMTRRYRVSRPVVVLGLLATVGIALIVVLTIMIPLVIGQTVELLESIRSGRFARTIARVEQFAPENYRDEIQSVLKWIGVSTASEQAPATQPDMVIAATAPQIEVVPTLNADEVRRIVREEMAQMPAERAPASSSIMDIVRRGGAAVMDVLGAIIRISLLAFLIPFYFFFFSVWYPDVVKFGQSLLPHSNRKRSMELLRKMDNAVAGFVRGRIVICFIVGVILAVGWWICDVPYAITLGMVVGAFFLVPYLAGVGLPLAIAFLWFDQITLPEAERMSWVWIIGGPSLVFGIVQILETYLLTPVIAGKATNLDPVTILVAVLAGGTVGGVYGMLLAIPAAACAKILITDVLLPRIKAWTQGKVSDPLPM
jgi:predicted PurR-regulated permease PerM